MILKYDKKKIWWQYYIADLAWQKEKDIYTAISSLLGNSTVLPGIFKFQMAMKKPKSEKLLCPIIQDPKLPLNIKFNKICNL